MAVRVVGFLLCALLSPNALDIKFAGRRNLGLLRGFRMSDETWKYRPPSAYSKRPF